MTRLKSFKNLSLILGAHLVLSPIFVFAGGMLGVSEAAAVELLEIRDRGYITIGVKDNRAPLSFLDDSGDYTGYEIEIARRLAKELLGDEAAVQFVPVQNIERLDAVISERVDIAIANITLTEPRRRLVDFSYPYYLDGTAFITQQPNITDLKDLRLGRIALLDRSSSVAHVRYILPGARLIGVGSYAEGQALLASGEADAFAGDASVLTGWIQTSPALSEYRLLPNLLSADPLAIAIPKGIRHDELRTEINAALRRWYQEGWLQDRADYWGLPAGVSQFVNLSPSGDIPVLNGEEER
ncbi:MAG: ABC transporter substrate-binding protein [Leptolyngbya foveolarum]|uniref:ABC transporter substrate-binding protein n=1 Tax=Leptolyngbya foveolarum TaxID=47253 RepID=A0A2W4WMD4_9CYAN|nr:MAG: ABC transporter substrate-binding protein [Leptolyngbya foveolarum]